MTFGVCFNFFLKTCAEVAQAMAKSYLLREGLHGFRRQRVGVVCLQAAMRRLRRTRVCEVVLAVRRLQVCVCG
jgi:hypothetical protein